MVFQFLKNLLQVKCIIIVLSLFFIIDAPAFGDNLCEEIFNRHTRQKNNELLKEIISTLNKESIDYALVGGYAMVLHGIRRDANDIDLIINHSAENFRKIEKVLNSNGFKSLIELRGDEVFYSLNNFINGEQQYVWSFYRNSEPYEYLDILLFYDLKAASVEIKNLFNTEFNVASIKDLIITKSMVSSRDKDLKDIEVLKASLKDKGIEIDLKKLKTIEFGNRTGKTSKHMFSPKDIYNRYNFLKQDNF